MLGEVTRLTDAGHTAWDVGSLDGGKGAAWLEKRSQYGRREAPEGGAG